MIFSRQSCQDKGSPRGELFQHLFAHSFHFHFRKEVEIRSKQFNNIAKFSGL